MIIKLQIILIAFLPSIMYGQLFNVEYVNNEKDTFVGVHINVVYSAVDSGDTTYNHQSILCSADKDTTNFSIAVLIVEDDVEIENNVIYNSNDKEDAIDKFKEWRDIYCEEFPANCKEIKKEFGKFIKFLSDK